MTNTNNNPTPPLPQSVQDYIDTVVKKIRYRRRIRNDVRNELIDHFTQALQDLSADPDRQTQAQQLIQEFGDPKLLATLIRRGKKRCRPPHIKALIRSAQLLAILIIFTIIRIATLALGKPNIATDYIAQLNQLTSQNRPESQNAHDDYLTANELINPDFDVWREDLISYDWPAELTPQQRQECADFLQANAPAIDRARKAAQKSHYWYSHTPDPAKQKELAAQLQTNVGILSPAQDKTFPSKTDPVIGVFDNYLDEALQSGGAHRRIAKLLGAQILHTAYQNQIPAALDDTYLLIRFAAQLQDTPLFIEKLCAASIQAFTANIIQQLIQNVPLTADQLQHLQTNLQTSPESYFTFTSERVFTYDFIQRNFTDDGHGNGRVIKRGLPLITNNWQSAAKGIFLTFPDRKQATALVNRYFDQAERFTNLEPHLYQDNTEFIDLWRNTAQQSLLLTLQQPGHERACQIQWREITLRRGLITTLAILRFQKQNNQLPQNLQQLTQQNLLKKLPIDPYSGQPFKYIKKTNTTFLLAKNVEKGAMGGSWKACKRGPPLGPIS